MPHKKFLFISLFLFFLWFQNHNTMANTKDTIRKINLDKNFIINNNETILVDSRFFFTFDGHSHKMVYENTVSPLIINVKYKVRFPKEEKEKEKSYYMFGDTPFVWRWKNYLFVVIKYEYGTTMEMKICADDSQE